MKQSFHKLILKVRNRHLLIADILVALFTPTMALLVRVDAFEKLEHWAVPLLIYTFLALCWKLVIFYSFGLFSREWRYANVEEWLIVAKAAMVSFGVGTAMFFLVMKPFAILPYSFPRSIPLTEGIVTALALAGLRLSVCVGYYLSVKGRDSGKHRRVLIAGAGVAGSMVVTELHTNPHLNLEPVGFVDDDPEKQGEYIHGVRVIGALADITMIVMDYEIDEVIIAMPTSPGKVVRTVVHACNQANVPSRTIPGIFEILGGTARVTEIRDVQIEDLLRRGVVKNDVARVASLVDGKRIMVTGAGGSIGAELSRQIHMLKPAELVLLGHGENSIFQIAAELRRQNAGSNVVTRTIIADIRDQVRMRHVFKSHKPQIIFHAAAHKHVGLMETNLPDAITNNVLGTKVLTELADQFHVERFILISSDKAVNSTCIMGATKRVAELIVHDAALKTGRAFSAVRFGNVLGSRGSVVPIFKQQIALGGPVYVTHPDAKRFFMTIPEAVQLVLEAANLGDGGEVFVLDMGEPVKVLDIALDLIRLTGYQVGTDIDIEYVGLQPGEKLEEELFFADEKVERSSHQKIFICRNGIFRDPSMSTSPHLSRASFSASRRPKGNEMLQMNVDRLIALAQEERLREALCLLKAIAPEIRIGEPFVKKSINSSNEHVSMPAHSTSLAPK